MSYRQRIANSRYPHIIIAGALVAALAGHACEATEAAPQPAAAILAERCAALAKPTPGLFQDATTRLIAASVIRSGPLEVAAPGSPPRTVTVPEHCEITGIAQERTAADGQHYAIRFHLRLPFAWNGRFFFQGGGGSNGTLGDALGSYSPGALPALLQGFAVASQDSGHDNQLNNDPGRGGPLVFGFDEQARLNYGHASLPIVAAAAKALIARLYPTPLQYSYFVGCSKGGNEGMALAQLYPDQFDGIAASAPGMSLPRAAVEEAWDTQALVSSLERSPSDTVSLSQLASSFSVTDLSLVRDAVLSACDADDGVTDGIVAAFPQCTTAKVLPKLNSRRCTGAKTAECLTVAQIKALTRLMEGAHDSAGHALYSNWPWDTGIAAPGWRTWKLGNPDGRPPSLNVILGGPSLAAVFTTPPTSLSADPGQALAFLLKFNFDHDAPGIYATQPGFPHSAWDDIGARSPDLSAFKARHGRLLVPHGVSDPVFSINDTLAWWREVDQRNAGHAADFVRVLPVPGMNHCGGGAATDVYDVLAPLMQWVEHDKAPDQIFASSNSGSPWPKRTRPLCVYPAIARYNGSGDIESATSFSCRK
jgi:Ni,Fe-hydrogenase III small subunit